MFISTIEVYLSSIYMLNKINLIAQRPEITQGIAEIRCLIENHQQDLTCITKLLDKLEKHMPSKYTGAMKKLIRGINSSQLDKQSLVERFVNPLNRRFESEMTIQFLLTPTTRMMEAVGEVSQHIINHLSQLSQSDADRKILSDIQHYILDEDLGFGYTDKLDDIETMIEVLGENATENLSAIMLVHFAYARVLLRLEEHDFCDVAPQRAASGKLADIIGEVFAVDNSSSFFEVISQDTASTFADKLFFDSALYSDRGRGAFVDNYNQCCTMGLVMSDDYFSWGLARSQAAWYPDARCQHPDLNSAYVKKTLESDVLYISGPSSMTALLLTQMELLVNMDSVERKQHYLLAIAAQLGAAGYHSLHEVLAPAALALDLIPDYDINCANYQQFYQVLMASDHEVMSCYQQAWSNFDDFIRDTYLPHNQGLQETLDYFLINKDYKRPQLNGYNPLLHKSYAVLPSFEEISSAVRHEQRIL